MSRFDANKIYAAFIAVTLFIGGLVTLYYLITS